VDLDLSDESKGASLMAGAVNFRDFGGAETLDGRRVVRGALFRSGQHAGLTDEDLERLAALDLGLIVDLRRAAERERDPSRRPPGLRAEILEHAAPPEPASAPHLAFLGDPDASRERITAQMIDGYRGYPFDPYYVALYHDYFARLSSVDGAVLIHCHAGKDRTGVLCALTLCLLGVGREAIFADYLATNLYNITDARLRTLSEQFVRDHGRPVSEALLRHVMTADAAWLDAAFDAMTQAHGDVDRYLESALGVTPEVRAAIRARFVV